MIGIRIWVILVRLTLMCHTPEPVTALLDELSYTDLTCTSSTVTDVGVDPSSIPTGELTGPDNNLAFSYVCENFKYMFKCCGKIKEWKLYAGKAGTIQLQVWRRTSTTVYEMIGENYCHITSIGTVTSCIVNDYDKILVRYGDFVGWHNQGNETIMYKEASNFGDSTLENLFRRIFAGDLFPGDTYDWSQVESYNDRIYALQAIYEQSNNPTISVADMTVPDYINSGDTIGRITYEDIDYMDNRSLVVVSTQTSAYYTTDLPSGYVTASNSFRPRDDNLEYYIYDLCMKTVTGTRSHSITVQPTTLKIDNLDATFTVAETSTTQTLLHTVTATDPVDEWYCYSDWSTLLPFMLKALTTQSYGFYLVEHPGLDYDSVTLYSSLPVKCLENSVTSTATVSANIQVYVTRNQPPTISNLDASVGVDSEIAIIGDLVFTVTATDPESEVVTFTMICTVTDGSVNADTFAMLANGNVVLKKFLTLASNYQYDCEVTAMDSDGNTDGTNHLHIYVQNINNPVSITNVPPNALQIQENMAMGTSIYTFQHLDVDTGALDTKTWTATYSDSDASRFFSIDPNSGLLSIAFAEIDYETVGSKTFTLTISVGDVKSSTSESLVIMFINQNEAPWFTEAFYTIEEDEGSDGTQLTDGSLFTFIDEDLNDGTNTYEDHFYSLDCDNVTNTQRFYINKDSGAIAYQGDYNIDVAGTPSQVSCTVTITDLFGLSDTADLYIYIKNVNEFSPEFTHSSYIFYLSSNTLIGTYLQTVSAVDYDSSDDDDDAITFTLNQAAFPAGAELLTISNDGAVYTAEDFSSYSGTLGPIEALASNYGVAGKTGTTLVTIEIQATTTVTTTTTDRSKDFYQNPWSYIWLLATMFGFILIIVGISVVCFRICRLTRIGPYCYNCCMKGLCCRPPKHKPQVRGFGDKGYDLASFGHRHAYADEGEIDGWLPSQRDTRNKKFKTSADSGGRYGRPNIGYDRSGDMRPEPIYEMFRIPSTSTIPMAANYQNSSTRQVPRNDVWKDRKPLNRPR